MYLTAVVGLRLAERRTLAQWSTIDFVVAVAVGAIVGRTAVASSQAYLVGATALVTLLALHRLLSLGRMSRHFAHLVDHPVRLLVRDGRFQRAQLRRSGLTEDDVLAELRQRGVDRLDDVRYLLYEAKGGLSVVARGSTVAGLDEVLGSREAPPT